MKAYKCDRCGKYYTPSPATRLTGIHERCMGMAGLTTDWSEVDLCDDCYESLQRWMGNEDIKKIDHGEGYIAIGALNNMLAKMELEFPEDALTDAWHAGWQSAWHNAIDSLRDRLQSAMRTGMIWKPEEDDDEHD